MRKIKKNDGNGKNNETESMRIELSIHIAEGWSCNPLKLFDLRKLRLYFTLVVTFT